MYPFQKRVIFLKIASQFRNLPSLPNDMRNGTFALLVPMSSEKEEVVGLVR
jgi:hypothetical protein